MVVSRQISASEICSSLLFPPPPPPPLKKKDYSFHPSTCKIRYAQRDRVIAPPEEQVGGSGWASFHCQSLPSPLRHSPLPGSMGRSLSSAKRRRQAWRTNYCWNDNSLLVNVRSGTTHVTLRKIAVGELAPNPKGGGAKKQPIAVLTLALFTWHSCGWCNRVVAIFLRTLSCHPVCQNAKAKANKWAVKETKKIFLRSRFYRLLLLPHPKLKFAVATRGKKWRILLQGCSDYNIYLKLLERRWGIPSEFLLGGAQYRIQTVWTYFWHILQLMKYQRVDLTVGDTVSIIKQIVCVALYKDTQA